MKLAILLGYLYDNTNYHEIIPYFAIITTETQMLINHFHLIFKE